MNQKGRMLDPQDAGARLTAHSGMRDFRHKPPPLDWRVDP